MQGQENNKLYVFRACLVLFLIIGITSIGEVKAQAGTTSQSMEESWEEALQMFKEFEKSELEPWDSAVVSMGLDSIPSAIQQKSDPLFFHYVVGAGKLFRSYKNTAKINEFLERTLHERLGQELSKDQKELYLAKLASTYTNKAFIARIDEDYEKATEFEYKSLDIRESLKDTLGMVSSLNGIGSYYFNIDKIEKAGETWKKSLELVEKNPYPYRKYLVRTYRLLVSYYNEVEEYDKAEVFISKGKELATELDKLHMIGLFSRELGLLYKRKEKYKEAYKELDKAYYLMGEFADLETQAIILFDMAEVAEKLNRKDKLKALAEDAYQLIEVGQSASIRGDCYFVLYLWHEKNGDFQKALTYYQKRVQLLDSLKKEKLESSMLEQEYEYEYGKKALADSLQQVKELAVKDEVNRRQRSGLIFSLLGLVLTLVFGGILWNRFRLTRSQKLIIEEEKEKLDEANTKLKELDNFKSDFFTNISHEFRTPLTVIKGMNQQVRQKPDAWLVKGTDLIEHNTGRLLHLINQILDLRKLESGSLILQYVQTDVIHALRLAAASFESMAESKGVDLHFEATEKEFVMDFDPEKLNQIFNNLLSNAIKFTSQGGKVSVNISVLEENQLSIEVVDTGIGIPEDKLAYIFDRFYQVDRADTREGEGTGVGLSLTKELVELMNGEIAVESRLGEGSTFTVLLPISHQATPVKALVEVAKVPVPFSSVPIAKTVDKDRPRLLIIEDNPDIVSYLYSLLEGQYDLSSAADGLSGIEAALEQVPDLIITDIMMPGKNGYEVTETLKLDERTSHIPIVMLTAKADQPSKIEGYKRGADAYLAKPFDEEELMIRLDKLWEIRQRLQLRYQQTTPLEASDDPVVEMEDAFVAKVRTTILEHIDDSNYRGEALCVDLGLSRSNLYRKIKALTGKSIAHFIRGVRLDYAKELLRSKEGIQIAEVAYVSGFNDPAYFNRVFKEEIGVSPGEWREG
ncbi:MAG: ATP-binding protein [Bacteroidota bacterium]